MTLGKLLNLAKPQFPHLLGGKDASTSLLGLL